jgi:surface protein
MNELFFNSSSFNDDISGWEVSNVRNMSAMFEKAATFNQPLNNWDVSNVKEGVQNMFFEAKAFNQPLDSWANLQHGNTCLCRAVLLT